jgi:uncharacterized protein
MRLNEVKYTDAVPIDGYGPGFFRVGGQVYQGGALILPTAVSTWGGYSDLKTVIAAADQVDVIFIGTGAEIAHIPADMRTALEGAGLGVEVMNSPSACRTFNVLLSEGRRIAAALLPV